MRLHTLSSKLGSVFAAAVLLSLSSTGCAPVSDDDLGLDSEELDEVETTEQAATTTYTPSAFSMSRAYYGTSMLGTSCSSGSAQSLTGHEPSASGRFPVAVWLTGTGADYKGQGALEFTANMAKLGFVAASVEYTNWNYPTCGTLKARASCVFNASSANSAISKLCARAKADCSKGIVVAGISQGANLASMAKNYDGRARAAYLVSNVVTPPFYNNSSCLKDSATKFTPSQVRAASGESDEFLLSISKVRSDLVTSTGHSCSGKNCMKSDGSGWYIVSNNEVVDGRADHCFLLNGGCNGKSGDSNYATGSAPWTGWTSLQWLASRASR